MKCSKCKREMVRVPYDENKYYFRCPNCKNTIGKPQEVEDVKEGNKEEK